MTRHLHKRVAGAGRRTARVVVAVSVVAAATFAAYWRVPAGTPAARLDATDPGAPVAGTEIRFGAADADSIESGPGSHIRTVDVQRVSPRPAVPPLAGLYGERTAAPRPDLRPYLEPPPAAAEWKSKRFATVVSELSPAVMYRSEHGELTFFNRIEAWGHSGPTHVAVRTSKGVLVGGTGQSIDGALQSEPWVLAWFAGAEGWMFDVPWLIVLERRARSIALGPGGLTLRFDGPAGTVIAMPFYGYYKVSRPGKRWADVLPGAVDFGIDTSTWATAFPRSVAARARWWSEVLRRYPVRCVESFRVDRLHDVLTIKSTFEYIDTADAWGTTPRTLAPLSPTLALALTDEHNRFPMRFSAPVTDPFIMTPHGPYMGVEGHASYEIEFDTLKYVHEVERPEPPPANSPQLVREAYARLQVTAARRWPTGDRVAVDHGDDNYVWAAMGDRFYPMALPYIADARVSANARQSLRRYFREWVLKDERFTDYTGPALPYRGVYLLHGPGIGSWGELGDAGKFAENLYPNLWSYAHYTGDVRTIQDRWNLVRKLDITPLESGWKGFGRNSIAELGDEAAPPIHYARLAWMAGDIDTYYYQCYIATRELLHHFVKQNGAQYFRKLQPYHQYFAQRGPRGVIEAIPDNVFISNLYGGLFGWQIDGPTYPAQHGERQYQNRWVRFSCPSVARFYRDHVREDELRAELREWKARFEEKPEPGPACQWVRDDPHIMPSLVRLLSLTVDGPLSEIQQLAVHEGLRMPYDSWRLYPDAAVFASAIAIVRLSHPRHYDRLIPRSGPPGPYVLGLERSIASQWSILVQQLENWDVNKKLAWPVVGWVQWQPPGRPSDLPGADLFSFGAVTPSPTTRPRSTGGWTQINWNTYTVWYE